MLVPKRPKYRKQFKRGARTMTSRGSSLSFGDYGLKSMALSRISEKQIEAARRVITHFTHRGGKVWIRVLADKPVTGKPAGTGMGAGKGEVKGYVAVITPGRIIFEIAGVPQEIGREALLRAAHKLPMKTKVVIKD